MTKVQNRRGRGFKLLPVLQTYLNLPPNLTINLNELYDAGRFIEEPAVENLIRLHGNINFRIGENTRIQLVSICKYILGQGSHHDGVKEVFGNTAPLLNPTPARYSSSNISGLQKTKMVTNTSDLLQELGKMNVFSKGEMEALEEQDRDCTHMVSSILMLSGLRHLDERAQVEARDYPYQ